jgi:hypothetical protein
MISVTEKDDGSLEIDLDKQVYNIFKSHADAEQLSIEDFVIKLLKDYLRKHIT